MPYFGRYEVLAKCFGNAGEMTVRHDSDSLDHLVVLTDKVHVSGEATEALPSGKALRMNQNAVEFGVIGEIRIDRCTETDKVLFAQRRVGLEHQDAFGFQYRVAEHVILYGPVRHRPLHVPRPLSQHDGVVPSESICGMINRIVPNASEAA